MAAVLIELAKGKDKRTALPAMRIFWDKIITGASEHVQEVQVQRGPTIYLPEEVKPGTPADLPDNVENIRRAKEAGGA